MTMIPPRTLSLPFLAILALALAVAGCPTDGEVPDEAATGSGEPSTGDTTTASAGSTTAAPTSTTDASTSAAGESSSTAATATTSEDDVTGEATTGDAAMCGDGVLGAGEACDLGPMNADDGPCTSACAEAKCGDGLVHAGVEECDHGDLNHDNGACTKTCKSAKCGDGLLFWGVEECDDGPNNQAGLYGGCTPMTCTKGPHCGDKVIQAPQEECDDGDQNGDQGMCTGGCAWNGSIVFATSKTYSGALGGIAGADDKCNTVAMEAGVPNAGSFMAWVGDSGTWPAKRMTPSPGRYLLRDGTVIASSWADLVDGALAAPIDRDETGAPLPQGSSRFAWTGVLSNGTASDPDKQCKGWKDEGKDQPGRRGSLDATDFTWSSAGDFPCWTQARLICVEQF